jgi:hypothetical protein
MGCSNLYVEQHRQYVTVSDEDWLRSNEPSVRNGCYMYHILVTFRYFQIFSTEYIYTFAAILTINIHYFPKQQLAIGVSNGNLASFMVDLNWMLNII